MPTKVKEMAEAKEKAVPQPAIEQQPEQPEKADGPLPIFRAASAPQPPRGPRQPADELLKNADSSLGVSSRARAMTALQRSVGNTRVSRIVDTGATTSAFSTAPTFMKRSLGAVPAIQRKCACGGVAGANGECAECQPDDQMAQRQTLSEDAQLSLPPSVSAVMRFSSGETLPMPARARMENALGTDLGGVRIHTGSQAARAAQDINAQAFTVGQDIYFGEGGYQPDNQSGQRLLAHELTHTVQQKNGGSAMQTDALISQPGDPLEQEADAVANQVSNGDGVSQDVPQSSVTRLWRQIAFRPQAIAIQSSPEPLTGSSSITTAVYRQPAATPDPPRTKPRAINIAIAPGTAVVFNTPTVLLGDLNVRVTGRMAINGKATLIGEELPEKGANAALQARVRELVQDDFNASKPAGAAERIEAPLGGETLMLELAPGTGQMPAWQVSARFTAKNRNLVVTGCEITNATLRLDATVWISPAKPPSTDNAQAGNPPVPGDASVTRFSFAGSEAQLQGKKRTGGVTLKSAMDAFEARVPDFVKQQKFLKLPEQRAAFFQEMRAYFGTDENTVTHFAGLRKANVKGATTWLHDEAATRLEAVQAEIGEENMPSSGGVGWPRSEAGFAGEQGLGNLHNIGFAVDYNAYQAPHIKDQRTLDLIQIVTGRSATASYGAPAGLDTRRVGETFTSGTDEEKAKLEADPRVQSWLGQVGSEAEAVSKASEDFRASLKTTGDAGVEVDLAPKLQDLRQKWFAAKTDADRQAILSELPTVLKPWLDKVEAQRKAAEEKITTAGLDPAALPTGKPLETAIKTTQNLSGRIKAQISRPGDNLSKARRKQIDRLIAEARKLLEEADSGPIDDADAIAELTRLADLLDNRNTALVRKKWLDRVNTLHSALTSDAAFVFGKSADKAVSNPPLAQITDIGFFTLRGKPGAGREAFNVDFVKSMVKHGFTHGATWSTPDLMHFELRWKGPGQG